MKQILLLVMAVWLVGIAQPLPLLAQVDAGAPADGDVGDAKGWSLLDLLGDPWFMVFLCFVLMIIEGLRKRRKKAELKRVLKAYDGKPEAKEGDTDD